MPRGGRRHRKTNAEHRLAGTFREDRHGRGDVRVLPPTRPPRPPKDLPEAERRAWLEVSRQVVAAGTYTVAHFSAFVLAVKALAAVYTAPADLKPTMLRGLIECASRMLARFGLDPVALKQVDVPPTEGAPDEDDPIAEFGAPLRKFGLRAHGRPNA